MNRWSEGSALIILLLVLSAGIVCGISLLKSSLLVRDIMHTREIYYQYQYATEGLLICGCAIASYNRVLLTQQCGSSATISFSQWPITDTKRGVGTITITAKTTTQIVVRSVLRVDNHAVCMRMCTVHVPLKEGVTHERLPATLSDWSSESA